MKLLHVVYLAAIIGAFFLIRWEHRRYRRRINADRARRDAVLEANRLYQHMQTPEHRKAVDHLLSASADELNRIAQARLNSTTPSKDEPK